MQWKERESEIGWRRHHQNDCEEKPCGSRIKLKLRLAVEVKKYKFLGKGEWRFENSVKNRLWSGNFKISVVVVRTVGKQLLRVKFRSARKLETTQKHLRRRRRRFQRGSRVSKFCCCCCYIAQKIRPSLYSIGFRSVSNSFKCGQSVTYYDFETDLWQKKLCFDRRLLRWNVEAKLSRPNQTRELSFLYKRFSSFK